MAIWVLSLAPLGEIEVVQDAQLSDKWAHCIMYGGFVIVMWAEWTLRRRDHPQPDHPQPLPKGGEKGVEKGGEKGASTLTFLVFPIVMGGLLELLQAYATTYRSGEWMDLLANTIGVVAGNVLALPFALYARRKAR